MAATWKPELLKRVLPAFAALAKHSIERHEKDSELRQHANDVFYDIVLIGAFLYRLHATGVTNQLNDKKMTKLLRALESRLPRMPGLYEKFKSILRIQSGHSQPRDEKQIVDSLHDLPLLKDLDESIQAEKCNAGDGECFLLQHQSAEQLKKYLNLSFFRTCNAIGESNELKFTLFQRAGRTDPDDCARFVRRIRKAAEEFDAVCQKAFPGGIPILKLAKHPSCGIREFADKAHKTFEQAWTCHPNCSTTNKKHVRLNLTRYRDLSAQLPSAELSRQRRESQLTTQFEVFFPICPERRAWKQVDLKVNNSRSSKVIGEPVTMICKSVSTLSALRARAEFLIQPENELWCLEVHDADADQYEMRSLHELLDTISSYDDQQKIQLCYNLATSLLYLYPGAWTHQLWKSTDIYFLGSKAQPPQLTGPYLSAEPVAWSGPTGDQPLRQAHKHPTILSLGIILIEILTGIPFNWSNLELENLGKNRLIAEHNVNYLEAKTRLEDLVTRKSQRTKVMQNVTQAITSCIKLDPPSTFSTLNLRDEGPVREYILSTIIGPLAVALKVGYGVGLGEWDSSLNSEGDINISYPNSEAAVNPTPSEALHLQDGSQMSMQPRKLRHQGTTSVWLEWHKQALTLKGKLQKGQHREPPDGPIRIAILDSGISLSQDHQDKYKTIKYRSWIDGELTQWNDLEVNNWKDDAGHGTHLAMLLLQIAPTAQIHVARVYENEPKLPQSAEPISNAIKYAVDFWEVDIIVIAFGFGSKDPLISDSIDYAARKKVGLFAAASNYGSNLPGNSTVQWPARDHNVICIHSGDGEGNKSKFTPPPEDGCRIMVLGEGVSSLWPPHFGRKGNMEVMSGTSCAVAIAAGIAALVLDYAWDFLKEQNERNNLRSVAGLKGMFVKMSHTMNGYLWVKHWGWPFDIKAKCDSDGDLASLKSWIEHEIRTRLNH